MIVELESSKQYSSCGGVLISYVARMVPSLSKQRSKACFFIGINKSVMRSCAPFKPAAGLINKLAVLYRIAFYLDNNIA